MSSLVRATRVARRLEQFGLETVWQEFSPLAVATGAVNLGQGFPDWPSPPFVKAAHCASQERDANQYCRSAGLPALVQALARKYSRLLGRAVDWETEVTVGVGASETLFATMQSLVDPGDEVVLISPAFDIYAAQVAMAGGVARYVPLRLVEPSGGGDPAWKLDMAELRAAFTSRTRVLLLNSPHNPTGKVFSRAELGDIAAVLADFPAVVAVSDEVYEHLVYDGAEFTRIATLPDMADRTISISSSGKTFSCTGWKIGWAVGPAHLIAGIILTNQWVQYSVSTPSQAAVAAMIEAAEEPYEGFSNYYAWLLDQYTRKRDILVSGLRSAGLRPVSPEGGFFIIANTTNYDVPEKFMALKTKAAPVMRRDWAFCRFLTEDIKVAAIPPSAFFEGSRATFDRALFRNAFVSAHPVHSHPSFADKDKDIARDIARFAFCKQDASLHEACKRLLALRPLARDASLLPVLPALASP
jgi:kynurenine--oxoglutarate transaminase/cysteine-S-conjugate beta-lyase/glutamine--phenylpyruvate transaminase